jgi:nitrogen fixation protein
MTPYMIELRVNDAGATARWLAATLDFSEMMRDPAGGFILMRAGDWRLAIRQKAPASTGINLVLAVDDLAAAGDRLRERGLEPGPVVAVPHERYHRFSVATPDGWTVTLFAWDRPGVSGSIAG